MTTLAPTSDPGPAQPPPGFVFYLGMHEGRRLADSPVPLCVAYPRLAKIKGELPRAVVPWILDSGGFNQVTKHGGYTITPKDYAREVKRFADEIGMLVWAACQDYMVEKPALAKTGRSVDGHQRLSIENYLTLRYEWGSDSPFVPPLQGDTRDAYLRHVDMYDRHGIDLTKAPLVSVGSVCRLQSTKEIVSILTALASLGLRMHGFGVKTLGLRRCWHLLASADSLAWSDNARWHVGDEEYMEMLDVPPHVHPRGGLTCSSCMPYALAWRNRMLRSLPEAPPHTVMEMPGLQVQGKPTDVELPRVRHRPGIPIFRAR